MKIFNFFKYTSIILVCLIGIFFTYINFYGSKQFESWKFNLGLDLKGGSDILLEINFNEFLENKLETSQDLLTRELRKENIGYKNIVRNNNTISFELRDITKENITRRIILRNLTDFSLDESSNGVFKISLNNQSIARMREAVKSQTIEVLRKRIDERGNKEISLQSASDNRIILQIPGISSKEEIHSLLNVTAKLSFHLMDESVPFLSSMPDTEFIGSSILTGYEASDPIFYVVKNRIEIDGGSLIGASSTIHNGQPAVTFELDSIGARRFAEITKQNIGRPFAIILDNKVLSAPNIREPIIGGSGVISGSFSIQEANQLSLLLRSGALPASIKIVEERIIGPSLGTDSIQAGKISVFMSLFAILAFMIVKYGIFGLFASISLIINIMLIITGLSLFGSTLTLPGIAGIALTIGIAVDINVLIFERIKELKGKYSNLAEKKRFLKTINEGFEGSIRPIMDANITTLLTAIVLYFLGFGPIKGFAITLIIGILTSIFSGIVITGILIKLFANYKKDTL